MPDKTMITQESNLCSLVVISILAATMGQYTTGAEPENVLLSWNGGSISYCPELENNKTFSFYTSLDI